jgi:hypothetical protein
MLVRDSGWLGRRGCRHHPSLIPSNAVVAHQTGADPVFRSWQMAMTNCEPIVASSKV